MTEIGSQYKITLKEFYFLATSYFVRIIVFLNKDYVAESAW